MGFECENMKHPKRYKISKWILETLNGYIEASKCRTLDTFATKEVNT